MHILHYTLGLAPYRSGGLTKYATDLMLAQNATGDSVSLLYPGDYTFWRYPKIEIIKKENIEGVSVFEIINPLPVPLLHGVRNPSCFIKKRRILSEESLKHFYNETQPEVMHIHTWMGMPSELVNYLKDRGVRIVFTSHDYYGLCLKVNFINRNGLFCESPGGEQCALCNSDAPSSLFLRLRNSKYVLKYKEKVILGHVKAGILKSANKYLKYSNPSQTICDEYSDLLIYYYKLFDLVDCFHFNSVISKEVYERYLNPKQSVLLPISHAGIKDARKLKIIDKKNIRMAFIGDTTTHKGFPMLKEVLRNFYQNGLLNWSLQVWGSNIGIGFDAEIDKIIYRGKYVANDLVSVFNEIDLLIVPSVCKETFSLITLEAISFGVPVLVSKNVGARDIVNIYNPDFIFQPTKEDLCAKLYNILSNPMHLTDYNKKIYSNKFEYFIEEHIQKLQAIYIDGIVED